jgi:hypothetical protein
MEQGLLVITLNYQRSFVRNATKKISLMIYQKPNIKTVIHSFLKIVEVFMTHQEILTAVSHFYPNIKRPNLVILDRSDIIKALDANYNAVNLEVKSDVTAKYLERGFIKTITGRYVRNIGEHVIYETLLSESARDIEKELYLKMNCCSPDAEYFICEEEDVTKTMKEVQEIVSNFAWKVPYTVKFGVVSGHEANCA